MFPGPTILSTLGIEEVPYAMAATACAPPTLNTASAPAISAATRTYGFTSPPGVGEQTITSFTPATFAGMTFIRTDDGYVAFPPGTYAPTRSRGLTICPRVTPPSSSKNQNS